MIVILLGPPGVGKGTQGKLLCDSRGFRHIATGDLLRAARREGTELGRKAQEYMDRGELVPDTVIIGMVEEVLRDLGDAPGVVMDGFPRTVPQAEAFDEALEGLGLKVDRVLVMTAPDEVLVKRVAGRRSCPACGSIYNVYYSPPAEDGICDSCGGELTQRKDDTVETVKNRLEVYRRQTEPLIAHYEESSSTVVAVDGDQSVEVVQAAFGQALV
jgi:adenylate kinase